MEQTWKSLKEKQALLVTKKLGYDYGDLTRKSKLSIEQVWGGVQLGSN